MSDKFIDEASAIYTSTNPASDANAKELLAAANTASDKVAVLHIAFLAVCAYLLVIVFSTTDMHLLVGKGIKLPLVDVELPIVGFFGTAPYLLLLVHFNLLLQLQLLSRKLYAFDRADFKQHGFGGLHEQVNIFPYNYYLLGWPNRLVKSLLALVVNITMLFLPLVVLLTVQAKFLAYQSEAVTWSHRIAIWLDVVLVTILWPVIMDRHNSWRPYIKGLFQPVRLHRVRWLWGCFGYLLIVFVLLFFGTHSTGDRILLFGLGAWLAGTLVTAFWNTLRSLSPRRWSEAFYVKEPSMLGAPGLVTILLLGFPMPLILVSNGETIDRPAAYSAKLMDSLRHLNLQETLLVATPVSAEVTAGLQSMDSEKETRPCEPFSLLISGSVAPRGQSAPCSDAKSRLP